jgi:hypothetical protein
VPQHLARAHELGDHQRFTLKWTIAVSFFLRPVVFSWQ